MRKCACDFDKNSLLIMAMSEIQDPRNGLSSLLPILVVPFGICGLALLTRRFFFCSSHAWTDLAIDLATIGMGFGAALLAHHQSMTFGLMLPRPSARVETVVIEIRAPKTFFVDHRWIWLQVGTAIAWLFCLFFCEMGKGHSCSGLLPAYNPTTATAISLFLGAFSAVTTGLMLIKSMRPTKG